MPKLFYSLFLLVFLGINILGCWIMALNDDSYITFRYAENLANGDGLTYEPGIRVLGTSTPLFALILAFFTLLSLSPLWISRAIVIMAELLLILTIHKYEKREGNNMLWIVFASIILFDPYILRLNVSGMESGLFTVLTIWALMLNTKGKFLWGMLIAVVSVWIRYEGLFTVGLCFLHSLYKTKKWDWKQVIAGILILGAPALWIWNYYGNIIPQSIQVKASHSGGRIIEVLDFFLGWNKDPFQFILSLTAVFGLVTSFKRSPLLQIFTIWAGIYLLSFLIVQPSIASWYCLPFYFFKSYATAQGVEYLLKKLPIKQKILLPFSYILIIFPLLFWSAIAIKQGESAITKNIIKPIKSFSKEHIKPGEVVFAHDVGYIGYYSQGKMLDYHGLVWPEYSSYWGNWGKLLKELKPQWAMVVIGNFYRDFLQDAELQSLYEPVARFSESGQRDFNFTEQDLNKSFGYDYLMLKLREP